MVASDNEPGPDTTRQRLLKMTSALSELFLDTEVRWWIPSIANTSLELDYGDDELQALLRYGITPELWPNRFSVAGEWAGFDDEALTDVVAVNLRASRFRKWWWDRLYRARAPVSDFETVMRFRHVLRGEQPVSRDKVVAVLTDLARIYFETLFDEDSRERIREASMTADKLAELVEVIIEHLGPLCYSHEKHSRQERDARLRSATASLVG